MKTQKHLVVFGLLVTLILILFGMGVASASEFIITRADLQAVLDNGLAGHLRFPQYTTLDDFETGIGLVSESVTFTDANGNTFTFTLDTTTITPDFTTGGETTTAVFQFTDFTPSGAYELDSGSIDMYDPYSVTINVYDTVSITKWPIAEKPFLFDQKYGDVQLVTASGDTIDDTSPEYYVTFAWDYAAGNKPIWGQTSANVRYTVKDTSDSYWLLHELSSATGSQSTSITVDAATLTVTLNDATGTYDKSSYGVTGSITCDNGQLYTLSSTEPGAVMYKKSTDPDSSYSTAIPVHQGTYTARYFPNTGFTGDDTATVTIDPITLNYTILTPLDLTYDGTSKVCTPSGTGLIDSGVTISVDYIPSGTPIAADDYTATLSIQGDTYGDYVWPGSVAPSESYTIEERPITATHTDMSDLAYNGGTWAVTWTLQNVVPSDAGSMNQVTKYQTDIGPALASDTTAPVNAGTYTSEVFFDNDNYVWETGFDTTLQYTIDPCPLTATHNDMTGLVYDGTQREVTWNLFGVVPADASSMNLVVKYKTDIGDALASDTTIPVNAGTYTSEVFFDNDNYVWDIGVVTTKQYTIAKCPITASPSDMTGLVYDGTQRAVTWDLVGVVPSDTGSMNQITKYQTDIGDALASDTTVPVNAGTYTSEIFFSNDNYEWQAGFDTTLQYTIDQRQITATHTDMTGLVYDGASKAVTWSLVNVVPADSGSMNKATKYETVTGPALASDTTVPVNAGTYTSEIFFSNDNYEWQAGFDTTLQYTIDQRQITATHTDMTGLVYDGASKAVTWSLVNVVPADSGSMNKATKYETVTGPALASDTTVPVNAGTYKSTVSFSNGNYEWQAGFDTTLQYTIDPRTITATHSDMTGLVYDGTSKAVTWNLQNVVPADAGIMHQVVKYENDVGYPLASDSTVPVNAGTYTSTVSFSNNNYVWQAGFATSLQYSIAPYDLSVTPVQVDCEWYQTAAPVLTYVHGAITGSMRVPAFSGALSCPAYNKEAVGNYPITQGTLDLLPGEVNDNYTIVFDTTKIVTVKYHIPSGLASVIPAAPDGENGWYKTKVVISAPAGYSISQSKNSGYAGSLSFDDGIPYVNGFSYYLRKSDTNATSNVIQLPSGFKQDTTAPTLISYGRGGATADRPEIFVISAADNLKLWKAEFYRGGSLVETDEISGTAGEVSYTMYAAGTYIGFVYDEAGNIVKTGYLNVEDTDADGLPDAWETALGTKPDAADTDGDGLSDGDEVLKYHTNPLVTDTDGDRLPDGLEVGAGLSPLKKDSNGDGVDDYVSYTLGFVNDDDLNMPLMARMLLGGALGDGRNQGIAGVFTDAQTAADALSQLVGYNFLKPDLQSDSPEDRLKAAKKSRKEITVVQLDINAGAGVGIMGDYLVTFSKGKNSLVLDSAVSLIPMGEMPSGSELVALASDDGSIVLMGYWNAAEKKVEGSLWVSAPKAGAGKLFEIAGSQGATAFDIARDGSSVAYCVGGKINKLYLTDKTPQIVTADGSANTLQYVGGDLMAVGADGSANKLEDDNTLSAAQVDEYDLRQRTNSSRSRVVMVNGEPVQVDMNNIIHVTSNRSSITFLNGNKEETASTVSEW